jgi:hypothetical protein
MAIAPLCEKLGNHARQHILQHHTWDNIAKKVINIALHN